MITVRELGGYRLVRQIGSGGMGTVWEAIDAEERRVALKLLHPHIADDPENRARLEREVRLLHRVKGEGVAQVLDAEVEGPDVFVVTELIEGPTLEADVRDRGPFTDQELAALARDLATALEDIHATGIVHRDLKPSNVMISEDGPVIIDFGIAQVVDETRMTQVGLVTGTPGYLDPEVMEGADPSAVGDWWAWAAVLVYAATGRHPFGSGRNEIIFHRLNSGDVDVEGVSPDVGAALSAALRRASRDRLTHDEVLDVLEGRVTGERLTALLAEPPDEDLANATAVITVDSPAPPRTMPPIVPPGSAPARDGHTRQMPVGGPRATSGGPQPGASAGSRPVGPAWGGAATPSPSPASPMPEPRANGYPPEVRFPDGSYPQNGGLPGVTVPNGPALPVPARQPGFLIAVALLLGATSTLMPVLAYLLLFAFLTIGATSGFTWWHLNDLIERRGERRGNTWRAALALPAQVLKGASVSLVAALLGLLVGAVAAGSVILFSGIPATPTPALRATLAASTVIAALVSWAVAPAEVARLGSRALIETIFPFTSLKTIFSLLVLAVAVIIATMVIGDVTLPMDWWPIPDPAAWWPSVAEPLP